ncbi:MAG: cbb3-type cytochrome c oxidase subunit II [Rhodobacter sp.]|nr:cbb3-type cytochrome c oxidase subunit II [Rhodobacter sp.]
MLLSSGADGLPDQVLPAVDRQLPGERDRLLRPYLRAAESACDQPMLRGSKRTGPDLARLGGSYSDSWHAFHLTDPRGVVPASIVPACPWLDRLLDTDSLDAQLATLAARGVPHDAAIIGKAQADALAQSHPGADGAADMQARHGETAALRAFDGGPARLTEMDALVAICNRQIR